eukprot:7945060-Pyramimonas_sp.AAC.1
MPVPRQAQPLTVPKGFKLRIQNVNQEFLQSFSQDSTQADLFNETLSEQWITQRIHEAMQNASNLILNARTISN